MNEANFNRKLTQWCAKVVTKYTKNMGEKKKELDLTTLVVRSANIYTGHIPTRKHEKEWKWKKFARQIDVVIGREVQVEGENIIVPLIAIELKAGKSLSSDELDKKSAIYGPLRELYPWVHTIFLHHDISERNLGSDYLLRNARHFNTIYTEWNKRTQALLKNLIFQQLDYQLGYWKL